MNRSELIQRLADKYPSLVLNDDKLSVTIILDAISAALARGERVEIRGFGSFKLNHRPARIGRNPKTGELVQVPAKVAPHFKAGMIMRRTIDQ
jgi:integration host factor subunit beta